MGEDIAEMGGSMGVTQGMVDEFGPERVRNTPISEMALAGAAIGAAMQGMRPVAEIMYEDFLTLATEQIVNQAAKHRYMSGGQLTVPVTFRTQGGAGLVAGRAARTAARVVVRPHSGIEGRVRLDSERRARIAVVLDLRRQPGRLLRAPNALRDQGRRARRARADPARKSTNPPAGRGRDGDRNRQARARIAGGCRGSREGGSLGRSRRSAGRCSLSTRRR